DDWDFTGALRGADFPITVINGDHDLVGFGGELHRLQLGPVSSVEFVMLENAGHNAWIDAPERHRAALREALAKYD
ncbi:MAG: alpha/beta fold hydrolase, partial [Gemmatimonadota bacterium]